MSQQQDIKDCKNCHYSDELNFCTISPLGWLGEEDCPDWREPKVSPVLKLDNCCPDETSATAEDGSVAFIR